MKKQRLFSFALFVGCFFPVLAYAAPNITVSATAVNLLGTSQNISITVSLVDPNRTGMLRVSGTGIVPIMTASTVTPGSTATVGPIYGNDVIIDGFGNLNGTYYKVQVFTVTGGIIASTPSFMNFYAFQGSGTVDLATATPLTPNFQTGTAGNVVLPGTLSVTGTSTLTGNVTMGGTATITGALTDSDTTNGIKSCIIQGAYVAGSSCYPTIQSAVNAASNSGNCAFTTNCGSVLIPAKYSGTDTYSIVNLNVLVIDQRSNLFNAPHMNVPTFVTSIASDSTYPAGRDMNFFAGGPAGLYFRRSTVDTTTTATLSVGANTSVLVGTVNNHNVDLGNVQTGTLLTLFSIGTGAAPQKITVGRGTANNEQLTYNATANCPTSGTWNIVDATHLCLNTTKTHSGTTDIEQQPDPVRFDFIDLQIRANQTRPSQDATTCLPMFINDSNGVMELMMPSDTTCAAPRNQPSFNSGFNIIVGGGAFSGNPPPTTWEGFALGTNVSTALSNKDQGGTQRGFIGPLFGADALNVAQNSTLPIRLQNNIFAGWRNAGNTDDDVVGFNASDQFLIARNFNGSTVIVTVPVNSAGTALVSGNGAGTPIQTKRVAGCATGAAQFNTCDTTVTWGTAFADANYTATCTGDVVTSGVPIIEGHSISGAKLAASISVRTIALTAVAAQFTTIDCTAVHD